MAVNRMDDTYRNLSLEILMLSKKFIETVLHMHRHLDIWMHNMDCHTHIARGYFPPVQTSKN